VAVLSTVLISRGVFPHLIELQRSREVRLRRGQRRRRLGGGRRAEHVLFGHLMEVKDVTRVSLCGGRRCTVLGGGVTRGNAVSTSAFCVATSVRREPRLVYALDAARDTDCASTA